MSIDVTILDGPLPDAAPWRIDGAGAVVCFEGVVRPSEAEQPITALRYETYDPMAERELARLAQRVMDEHGLLAVRIEHSRGVVPNFACSFRLRVASAHRKEALAAMNQFIDRMKQDVPIWKHAVVAEAAQGGRGGDER